jgi:hypothetical protein
MKWILDLSIMTPLVSWVEALVRCVIMWRIAPLQSSNVLAFAKAWLKNLSQGTP